MLPDTRLRGSDDLGDALGRSPYAASKVVFSVDTGGKERQKCEKRRPSQDIGEHP